MMNQQPQGYPTLTKSYKGRYPFKICTTSFIYPDHYIPNVKMLGPYLDEIELLFFESRYAGALPAGSVITDLDRLAAEFDLSYNAHLPTDVSISAPDPAGQKEAVATMIRAIELVQPLDPSALILHVPYDGESFNEHDKINWQDRVYQNLVKILSAVENNKIIAIETLDYPMELLEEIIIELDLSICLDLGHLMVYDYDVLEVFNKFAFKTSTLHVHGVENSSDHMTLEKLSDNVFESVRQVLNQFTGVVSLEVFSFENLDSSLKYLESRWRKN
jgi:sugar phosphate isomerase/epimerase